MDGIPGRMPGSDALKFFKYDTDFQNVNQIRALTTLAQRERGATGRNITVRTRSLPSARILCIFLSDPLRKFLAEKN
jgi:hypothetical protein